ncbi:AAA family ATPase [Streptomyces sp. NPDC056061]|uniref:AAA family ATPase n=1 Tax=Streptomyces sp. NPDC056061 TaxID=3345700 RepID=UPI0035D54298
MSASTIVASGGAFRLYGDSVQTFNRLPVATYAISFSEMNGYSLHQTEPLAPSEETIYGDHAARVKRIVRGYQAMDRSLGVILSGDKGMGKSLVIRMLAERARDELGLPTVLVSHDTPGLASFLDELGEAVIVFDEFEKAFSIREDDNPQNQFLSLFDGLSTTKRLYVLSVNQLHRVSDYMLNRPGRLHYHMRFAYPDADMVAGYLRDQVPGIDDLQVAEVVDFSRKYDVSFDHLRAIAFELSLGERFAEVIADLNIKRTNDRGYDTVQASISWADGSTDVTSGHIDLFDHDALQSISDWELGVELSFRIRDARPSKDGYVLPGDAFKITGTRDEEQKAEEERSFDALAVTLRRPQKESIDF